MPENGDNYKVRIPNQEGGVEEISPAEVGIPYPVEEIKIAPEPYVNPYVDRDTALTDPVEFGKQLSGIVNDPAFDQLPFEDRYQTLQDLYSSRDWDEGADETYKEAAEAIRNADGVLIQEQDYQDLIPPIPDLDKIEGPEDKLRAIDDWEVSAKAAGKINGGAEWVAMEDQAEQQIETMADVLKRPILGEGVGAERTVLSQVAKGALTTGTRLIPGEVGDALTRAVQTSEWLPENPVYDQDKIPFTDIPVRDVASGIGNLVTFLAGGAGLTALGTKTAASAMLGANVRLNYKEAYDKAYQLTQDSDTATEAAVGTLPASALSTVGDVAVVTKVTTPVVKYLSNPTLKKVVSNLATNNKLGRNLKDGFGVVSSKVAASKALPVIKGVGTFAGKGVIEAGTEVLEEYALGESVYKATGMEEARTAEGELKTAALVGFIGGGFIGALQQASSAEQTKRAITKLREAPKKRITQLEGLLDKANNQLNRVDLDQKKRELIENNIKEVENEIGFIRENEEVYQEQVNSLEQEAVGKPMVEEIEPQLEEVTTEDGKKIVTAPEGTEVPIENIDRTLTLDESLRGAAIIETPETRSEIRNQQLQVTGELSKVLNQLSRKGLDPAQKPLLEQSRDILEQQWFALEEQRKAEAPQEVEVEGEMIGEVPVEPEIIKEVEPEISSEEVIIPEDISAEEVDVDIRLAQRAIKEYTSLLADPTVPEMEKEVYKDLVTEMESELQTLESQRMAIADRDIAAQPEARTQEQITLAKEIAATEGLLKDGLPDEVRTTIEGRADKLRKRLRKISKPVEEVTPKPKTGALTPTQAKVQETTNIKLQEQRIDTMDAAIQEDPTITEVEKEEVSKDAEEAKEYIQSQRGVELEATEPVETEAGDIQYSPSPPADLPTTNGNTIAGYGYPAAVPYIPVHPSYAMSQPIPKGFPINFKESTPAEREKGITAPDVMDTLSKILSTIGASTPIFEGTARGRAAKKALGWFETLPDVIRTRSVNDISTSAHEIAHALEQYMVLADNNPWEITPSKPGKVPNPWVKMGKKIQKELITLGRELYGDAKPAGGYSREGWAEFFRMYTTGGPSAKTKASLEAIAPNTIEWFESDFVPKIPGFDKSLKNARKASEIYFGQDKKKLVRLSQVGTRVWHQRQRQFFEGISELKRKAINFVEEGYVLKEFEKFADEQSKRRLGKEITYDDKVYEIFKAYRGSAPAIAKTIIEDGMMDFAGNRTGEKGLKQILDQIPEKDMGNFVDYLYARRAKALWLDPNRAKALWLDPNRAKALWLDPNRAEEGKSPRNPGIPLDAAEEVIAAYDSGLFQRTAQDIYNFQKGILRYMSQASPEYARVNARIEKIDPGSYIPLEREFRNIDKHWSAKSGKTGKSPVQYMSEYGSGRRVQNILGTIVKNTEAYVKAAQRRFLVDRLIELSEVPGVGRYITKIDARTGNITNKKLGDYLKEVENTVKAAIGKGFEIGVDDKTLAELTAEENELIDREVSIYTQAFKEPKGEFYYIPFYKDGQPQFYQVDRNIYEAIMSSPSADLNAFVRLLGVLPARTLRMGATGVNAGFALTINPYRDLFSFLRQRSSQSSFGTAVSQWMAEVARGLAQIASFNYYTDDVIDLSKRLGGELTTAVSQDRKVADTVAKKLKERGWKKIISPGSVVDFIHQLFGVMEQAPRRAEMVLLLKDMGLKPGDQITTAQAQQLLLAYKQVTTDFTAGSKLSRTINSVVPFFNVAFQGKRAYYRALRDRPGQTLFRTALTGTVLAIANWWRNKDEDWWKEMTTDEKMLYTYIPVDLTDIGLGKQMLRLPRLGDVDGVFMNLAEASLDAWYKDNPEELKEWLGAYLNTASPVGFSNSSMLSRLPVALKYGLELYHNEQYFGERPIVPPQVMNNRFPEREFTPYTTETAKKLGKMFGVSPIKIEHFIRSFTAGAGMETLQTSDVLLGLNKEKDKQTGMRDLPIVGRLWQRGGQRPSTYKTVNKFYDYLEDYGQIQLDETEEQRQRRLLLGDASRVLRALNYLRNGEADEGIRIMYEKEKVRVAKEAMEYIDLELPVSKSERKKLKRQAKELEKQVKPLKEEAKQERIAQF